MKKTILVIVLIGMSFNVKGQVNDTGDKVGIGTSNPSVKLEVTENSSTDAIGLRLTNSAWASNMSTSIEFKTGSLKSVPTSKISSIMNGSGNAGDRLGFFVQENGVSPNNNTLIEKLSLLPNGNVGIGMTNPTSKLDISAASSDLSILKLKNMTWACNQRTAIEFWNGGLKEYATSRIVSQMDGCGTQGEALLFETQTAGETNPTAKMVIKNNGNIGIGTINPGSWKLAVNGQIRAKEIKVETGWSDFVFKSNYLLPTLKEVENHIKEKGHLKDIPSAKEVAENGVYLGEMDSKLLLKIEELTLYTIQQQKEIIEQKEIVEEQAKEIEFLKSLTAELTSLKADIEKLKAKE